ncbi:MAG: hypothetical protein K9H64_02020 [Bacteroidales bacterium]|nr:hypothetical protein [Bacteroidales bacterium]MCF8454677.1 hypothetical protein [Bacteroidales bacterium]
MKNWPYFLITNILVLFLHSSCKKEKVENPPTLYLKAGDNYTSDSSFVAIGGKIVFGIVAEGIDAPITNLSIKAEGKNGITTMLDTGIYEDNFEWSKVFYQGVDDTLNWIIAVMDHNRQQVSVSRWIFKDPNSSFGGLRYYPSIKLGYQGNLEYGHYFDPVTGKVFFADSAQLFQESIDMLCYFKYSEDNGVNLPSPTFSSPGENTALTGELYEDFYPELASWTTVNYTKWDISADNGITSDEFTNAHNDSLLIVSYNDVWGKKKYKWAMPGLFIPFQTTAGKKGILKVLAADTTETGIIEFAMKIQY